MALPAMNRSISSDTFANMIDAGEPFLFCPIRYGLQLLQHGKSFAITGPSGAGKSILVQHLLSSLDANYYQGLHIHYGGLQRIALLKVVAEQLGLKTSGRAVPLLVKLQKHIATIATGRWPVNRSRAFMDQGNACAI